MKNFEQSTIYPHCTYLMLGTGVAHYLSIQIISKFFSYLISIALHIFEVVRL